MARLRDYLATGFATADVALDGFLLVTAIAGCWTSVDATVGAIVANAEIDGTATPCKELRRHQQQNEQRPDHESTKGERVQQFLNLIGSLPPGR